MSITALTNTSTSPSVSAQQFYKTRQADLHQLGKDLDTGDIAGAQSEYQDIVNLGQNGPFASGNAFSNPTREQDFAAIGQALQSGNISGAQQAFGNLKASFAKPVQDPILSTNPVSNPILRPLASELLNSGSGSGTSTSASPYLNIASLESTLGSAAASAIPYESLSVSA
jgi:hypothetical protein